MKNRATQKDNTSRRKGRKKDDKNSGKPRRPLSAYNIFFAIERMNIIHEQERKNHNADNHKDVLKLYCTRANVGFANLATMVSRRWKNVDEAYKKELEAMACRDRIRYKNEMKEWLSKPKTNVMEEKETHTEQEVDNSLEKAKDSTSNEAKQEWDNKRNEPSAKLEQDSPSATTNDTCTFKKEPSLGNSSGTGYKSPDLCFPCVTSCVRESTPYVAVGTNFNHVPFTPSFEKQKLENWSGRATYSPSKEVIREQNNRQDWDFVKRDNELPSGTTNGALTFMKEPSLDSPSTTCYHYPDRCLPCASPATHPTCVADGNSFNIVTVSPSTKKQKLDSSLVTQLRLPFNFDTNGTESKPYQDLSGLCTFDEKIPPNQKHLPHLPFAEGITNGFRGCMLPTIQENVPYNITRNKLGRPNNGYSFDSKVAELPQDPPIEFIRAFFGIDPKKNNVGQFE